MLLGILSLLQDMSVETAAVKDGTEGADPSLQAEIDTLLCMMESHRE